MLDPEDEGFALYRSFLAICALKLHQRAEDEDQEEHEREVDEAFHLFLTPPAAGNNGHNTSSHSTSSNREASTSLAAVRGESWLSNASSAVSGASGGHGDKIITLANLRRVATLLKEDVDDALLRDMILEANGGAGVGKGVRRDEFEKVMRRAGAWR